MSTRKSKNSLLSIFALFGVCAEAKESDHQSSKGLVVRSESEASLAVKDVANRLNEMKQRSKQTHNRLLALQDMLAQDGRDVGKVDVAVALSDTAAQSFKVLDAEFFLNRILIVNYTNPITLDNQKAPLPVFSGALPTGQYELVAKMTLGALPYGAVFKVAQGQWLAEKTFSFEINQNADVSKTIIVKPSADGPVLEWVNAGKEAL